ncbi:helix-turn-helix transcriptional regulator [Achromobacter xylosoxidans]
MRQQPSPRADSAASNAASPAPIGLLATALRRERERAGMSLAELARRAGLAKSTLSQLESGTGNPSLETLWALAMALDVQVSRLIGEAQARCRSFARTKALPPCPSRATMRPRCWPPARRARSVMCTGCGRSPAKRGCPSRMARA